MGQFSEVLKAVGPNASIVFAAWIFMGFLQQRYDAALDRYQQAVADYRSNEHSPNRSGNLRSQALSYRHRCRLMGWATFFGLLAAILLISSLIFSGLDALISKSVVIMVCGVGSTIGGLALVIVATVIVMIESQVVKRQIDDELRDVPELAEETVGGVAGEP